MIFKLKDCEGPLSILRGESLNDLIRLAARVAAYHTKFRTERSLKVDYWRVDGAGCDTIAIEPAAKEAVDELRI